MAKNDKKKRDAKEGFVLLQAPSNVTSCSSDGVEYPADDDNVVEVPASAVRALTIDHGFIAL